MFIRYYLFSKHRDIYRKIAVKLNCSPQDVYRFAHKEHIIPVTPLEEDIKAELIKYHLISRTSKRSHSTNQESNPND